MALVGVGTAVLFFILSFGLVLLRGAGGEVVGLTLLLVAALGSVAMAMVIRHYGSVRQRQEREAKLRLR